MLYDPTGCNRSVRRLEAKFKNGAQGLRRKDMKSMFQYEAYVKSSIKMFSAVLTAMQNGGLF